MSRKENTKKTDSPRMISGITKDSSITKLAPVAKRPCHRSIPNAKATPKGTTIAMVVSDSLRLWITAECSSGSCRSESEGSVHHHWMLKRCTVLLDRLALNDTAIAITSGIRDHARYPHVIIARIVGRRHGFRSRRRTNPPRGRTRVFGAVSTLSLIASTTTLPCSACSRASG